MTFRVEFSQHLSQRPPSGISYCSSPLLSLSSPWGLVSPPMALSFGESSVTTPCASSALPPGALGNAGALGVLHHSFHPDPGGWNPVQDLHRPDPEPSRGNSQINGVGGLG